ncbi:Outer membrane efflux protein [Chitinophaga terrae (ex Kim and Jung 2007)]|uniref:Outer membrane efflux protein n=1 Tax=Chitinophaga terrae (ex Kim and Jung 2007) TaxID=408074 RepID=A0A1H4CC84_9BACT|nr:TolC family protein [Chitinophaga terrae (ex Kim and Jung 2007)]MDQ0109388.1 hypothetical protein [Chitinophaga terrae (ex Kim and Jung 2007)]GEP88891.1 hypothetical protein CTE07_05360 [Chitinophaga terrae (ex Kim and Jung 2007)]SEA58065.1 Outer membrane efflux protein [Chitinophaga terrae (ex Kim and Jung 2007)]
MKTIITAVLLLCISFSSWAQLQRKDTSVLLKLPADPSNVARFKAKLVELALQNPAITKYAVSKEINKYDKRIVGAQWLNHFSAAGNLNEFTIKGNSNTNNVFYPRYNFGVLLPIGNLLKIPNETKRVKAEGRLLDKERESEVLAIKSKVLNLYEDYAANKQLYELHAPLLEDALLHFSQVEEKFRNNQDGVSLEQYKEAYRSYNGEMVKKIELEKLLRKSKLDLEEVVGMSLEEVMLKL